MSSSTVMNLNLSDAILDGINPKTTKPDDHKKANTKYYGIPAEILDGMYPKVEYNQEVNGEDKLEKTIF